MNNAGDDYKMGYARSLEILDDPGVGLANIDILLKELATQRALDGGAGERVKEHST